MTWDEVARQVTPQADQTQAATVAFARLVAAYYRTLREHGIGVESATYLTRDYQALCVQAGRAQGTR